MNHSRRPFRLAWLVFSLTGSLSVPAQDSAPAVPANAPVGAAKVEHVVVVVWDGLRPDSVTDEATPTLARLAREGVTFTRHHSVYPSTTEVNGTAMATGCYPGRSGIIGNREFRPAIDPFHSIAMEELLSVRVGDAVSGHHYLRAPTLAELVRTAGWRTAVAGTKAVALLHDRGQRPESGNPAAASVTLFSGNTLPGGAAEFLARTLGSSFPPLTDLPNVTEDAWTTRALTQGLWKDNLPKFSLLWLSEPDFTQHKFGPESPQARRALGSSDANLAAVLSTLEVRGWRQQTDVFVVSDHGFSTIGQPINVEKDLLAAGLDAVRDFRTEPRTGQVMVVGLGGVVFLYVVGHDDSTIQRLTDVLQRTEYAGVILTRTAQAGTFPLAAVHLDSPDAPDVVVGLRWNDERNAHQLPGLIYSDGERKAGQGSHGSFSRFEMHNTLIAGGPDFRPGFRDELPSSNIDLAPTVARILRLPNVPPMDGRVLEEALVDGSMATVAEPVTQRVGASRDIGSAAAWRQYLQTTAYGGETYLDEGNAGN